MTNPFNSLGSSDSGLLDGWDKILPGDYLSDEERAKQADRERIAQSPVDSAAPEKSLVDTPLPEGMMGRLRQWVDTLPSDSESTGEAAE
ncbi:hypothetical protein Mal64_36490 [Pseudobythopirellula maris]|uniref:Uncharacterized protein n=1 Tax=Pseudobythopirellula maris TaxID=2527991 RepID=A0A5C5ZHD4_9BACT|nr:hypothetical protein [Pseudobythopirellula maris]TWT86819.1 hypothetical protein Mal64_36490 [Pseudobythopirellula maris]